MGRVIVYTAILLGAAYSVPALRQRTVGPTDRVWERVSPYIRRVTDPIKRDITKREETAIAGRIKQARLEVRPTPEPENFQKWLKDNISAESDGWDHLYYLSVNEDGTTWVGSAGPDGIAHTRDDVLTQVVW